MPRLCALSLNAWTDPERLDERTHEMVRGIQQLSPAIVCLQEISVPKVKTIIRQRLAHQYHILQTDHYSISFPLLAYAPLTAYIALASAFVGGQGAASAGDALGSLQQWLQNVATRPSSIPPGHTTLLFWLAMALVGALLVSPQGIYLLARLALAGTLKPDLMAQTILVRRSPDRNAAAAAAVAASAAIAAGDDDAVGAIRNSAIGWDTAELVRVQPFPHGIRGYPTPSSVRQWPWYWIQHCLLRPGFMIIKASNAGRGSGCRDAWVVGTHLVISKPGTDRNDTRLQQVQYLQATLLSQVDRALSGDSSSSPSAAAAAKAEQQKDRMNNRSWLQKRWDDHAAKLDAKAQKQLRRGAQAWRDQDQAKPPLLLVAGDFNAPDHSPEIQIGRAHV